MLFVDFPQIIISKLPSEFRAEASATRWNNPTAPSIPFEQHSIVMLYAAYQDQAATSLHLADRPRVADLLVRHGLIIYFVSLACERFHITNLLGPLKWLQMTGSMNPPQKVYPVRMEPYFELFSRYGHLISQTRGLTVGASLATFELAVNHFQRQGLTTLAVFHSRATYHPIALQWMQANGTIIMLPIFQHQAFPEIITFIKEEVLPSRFPHLIQTESDVWLKDSRYLMEPVRALVHQKEQVVDEYRQRLVQLDDQIRRVSESEQEPFSILLTATGDALKHAVMVAFQYLGMHAVDVDDYWRERSPGRQKEEDLWAAERQFALEADAFRLVEVTSNGRGGASEDDCGRIVRYLLRRRREFSNSGITGLLVINHQYRTPAHVRRPSFTATQIADAVRDGYGLTSTYELFKGIRAEKAGRISKQQIVQVLLTGSGYMAFPEI